MICELSKVKIDGAYQPDIILSFSMNAKVNNHGMVNYSGIINNKRKKDMQSLLFEKSGKKTIRVYIENKMVFVGFPISFSYSEADIDSSVIFVTLISLTKIMDTLPQKRFYQDENQTYTEILKESYKNSNQNASILSSDGNIKIDLPALQYNETDWEFTLRIASRIRSTVIPNICADVPQLALGIPNRMKHYDNESLIVAKEIVNFNSDMTVGHHYFYTIKDCDSNYDLADCIIIENKELYVIEKIIWQKENYLTNSYLLADIKALTPSASKQNKITGLELEGKVVGVSNTALKVCLDIDIPRKPKNFTWVPYSPNTNNAMYSMPLLNEKVTLQWQSNNEADILSTRCVRRFDELPEHSDKYWVNEYEQEMSMYGASTNFNTKECNINLSSGSMYASTRKNYEMSASNIELVAKRIFVKSPEQIILTGANYESEIKMRLNEIYISAESTNIQESVNPDISMPPDFITMTPFVISADKVAQIVGNNPASSKA